MRTTVAKLAAAVATTLLLTVAAAAPAVAENAGGPAPVPSGAKPPASGTVPADGNPGTYGPTCVRIDLLPNYPGYLVLDYAWAVVVMSDGVNSNIYYNAQVGDTLYTPSGNSLIYVIKCGLGGNGHYTKGDVVVVADPIKVGDQRKIRFSVDGCQPYSTVTVLINGGYAQYFEVPASGYLTGYIVLDPSIPDPAQLTASCNDYQITVPFDDRSLDLVLGATGGDTDTTLGGGTEPVDPGDGSVQPTNTGDGTVVQANTGDGTVTVPTSVSPAQAALLAAAATDGAVSIELASEPGRSFTLAEIEERVVNPATVESVVTALADGNGGVDYVVGGAPIVGDAAVGAVADAAGSVGSSIPVARVALGGLAGLGLLAFGLRRRTGRATIKLPV